jgi:hypothetical protein
MTQGDSISRLTKEIDDFLRGRVAQQPDYLFSCWLSRLRRVEIQNRLGVSDRRRLHRAVMMQWAR